MSTGVGAAFTRVATRGACWPGVRARLMVHRDRVLAGRHHQKTTDIRLRLVRQLQHAAGRGCSACAWGRGLCYMRDERGPGARAGLYGQWLGKTTWAMLPAAESKAIVVLRI